MKKRILSILLALALCAGLAPMHVMAAEETLDGGFVVEDGTVTPSSEEDPPETLEPEPESDFLITDGVLIRYQGTATDVVIPDGVTSIKNGAFISHGKNVVNLTLPDSMTSVNYLSTCSNLQSVKIGNGVTKIEDYAFMDCANLRQVEFGDHVTEIGTYAFCRCSSLEEIILPDSVKTIGDHAFADCKKLNNVDLGHGLVTIGDGALRDCDDLTEIVIPESVTSLGHAAFWHTYGPTYIYVKGPSKLLSAYIPDNFSILVPGTFDENGEFVPDVEIPPISDPEDKWAEWRRVQAEREQSVAGYKNDASYQERLQQNQEYLNSDFYGFGKLAYAYIIVTDDVQAQSDRICQGLETDLDKVFAIHEWMTENIYYDYPYYYSSFSEDVEHSRTAQEVLNRRTGICEGYSFLFQALCWAQKIPCICNVGWTTSGPHGWDLVKVGDKWLWVDTTWDTYNAYYGDDNWQKGSTRLDYFLCSTEVISIDHATASNEGILMNPIGLSADQNVTYPYYQIYSDLRWNEDYYLIQPYYYLSTFSDEELAEASKVRVEYGLTPYERVKNETTKPSEGGSGSGSTQTSGGGGGGGSTQTTTSDLIDKQEQERLEQERLAQEKLDQLFRNPDLSDWAREEVFNALQASLVPEHLRRDYRQDITREEFCELMVQLVTKHTGKDIDTYLAQQGLKRTNPFADTTNSDVLAAYALGIVKGTSDTTFNPGGHITRQEAATMLARTAKVLSMKATQSVDFADADTFADWSKDSISFISGITDPTNGKKVMEGTGGGNFSPFGTYTREQAILTALRLFHSKG